MAKNTKKENTTKGDKKVTTKKVTTKKTPVKKKTPAKYASRWDKKGEPLSDLAKIIEYANILIEEQKKNTRSPTFYGKTDQE